MRCVTAVLLILAFSSFGEDLSDSSGIDVIEVFRAETPEELEAALSDGYPMPWLEEILNDGSIPEEDRYWLDCRVRAAIARDLQVFYNREGNPVHIDCDYLHPGEDYWREHFIINPSGDSYWYDTPDLPTRIIDQPGYIMNLYGEKVGDIAMTRCRVWLSRDASVGITRTGIPGSESIGMDYACFLYPDGSFIEKEIDPVFVQFALSESGNVAVFYSRSRREYNPGSNERMLYAFDRNGDMVFQRLMPTWPLSGSSTPAISPDDRYIATGLYPGEVWLLDAQTGKLLQTWGGGGQENRENWVWGGQLYFTPDSRFLCDGSLKIFDCETGDPIVWIESEEKESLTPEDRLNKGYIYCTATSDVRLITDVAWIDSCPHGNTTCNIVSAIELRDYACNLLYTEPSNLVPYLSPNGVFLLGENYDSGFFGGEGDMDTATPFEVISLGEVQ